jgi:putative PIN family toxin of toxin-antitoxin system
MPEGHVVVFDTNVLIPLLLTASQSTRLFLRLEAARWRVAASPQILQEVGEKVRRKESVRKWIRLSDEEIEVFLQESLPDMVTLVQGVRNAHGAVVADPTDDKIVAAALEAGAGYIISEDKHLLDLSEYRGIKIMSRDEFGAELDRLGVP